MHTAGRRRRHCKIKRFDYLTEQKSRDAICDVILAQTTTGAAAVTFDRPFVLMILSKDGSVPLLMANYFSPTDKLRALEAMERRMKAAAKEHMDL